MTEVGQRLIKASQETASIARGSVTPGQLRYHADRSEARGRHATAIFCRQAADEIERLRAEVATLKCILDEGPS